MDQIPQRIFRARIFGGRHGISRQGFCLVLLSLCLAFPGSAGTLAQGESPEGVPDSGLSYAETLFDPGFVHQIDIRIPEESWDGILADPVSKTAYRADIRVDGEEFRDVSFATKGNSSLYFVAADPESSRYSFKVNFGKYTDGQTYHGLNKLSLNNGFSDRTGMKDWLCYRIFREAGVPAPLTSYVWLTVNGRDQGLYLAVEDLSESFLAREFRGEGVIYKPASKDLELSLDQVEEIQKNGLSMTKDPHGADLVYTDDDPDSYPDIFDNAETHAEEEDILAVIAAMKCLAEGTDPGSCLDTGEVIRFFAAHNFVLNYDSYTGAMLHNLVFHEGNGILSLIPWDYNAAFGAFIPSIGEDVLEDATRIVNQGIDTPLIGASPESRPLWRWIPENAAFLEEYHEALDSLIAGFFESGDCEKEIDALFEMLLPYMEKDPTAFYSPEELRTGCEVLKQFCSRRAMSVRKQLDGELAPSGPEQADSDKVDASDLSITDMGDTVAGEE